MIEPKERLRGDLADRAQSAIVQVTTDAIASAQRSLAQAGSADCATCGQPIAPQRRAALPSARRCTPCQNHFEHNHGATR
jgi:RNA polymerase-binding transcription factor DksA